MHNTLIFIFIYLHTLFVCTLANITHYIDLTCTDGDIRLVGGTSDLEGRIEMCYNNFWGQVCDNSWSNYDAQTVCRQLGFQTQGTCMFIENAVIKAIKVIDKI